MGYELTRSILCDGDIDYSEMIFVIRDKQKRLKNVEDMEVGNSTAAAFESSSLSMETSF